MYMQKKRMTPKEIHADMVQILAEESLSYTTVKKCAVRFKQDTYSKDDLRSGRSKISTPDEKVKAIYRIVIDGRRLTVQLTAKSTLF